MTEQFYYGILALCHQPQKTLSRSAIEHAFHDGNVAVLDERIRNKLVGKGSGLILKTGQSVANDISCNPADMNKIAVAYGNGRIGLWDIRQSKSPYYSIFAHIAGRAQCVSWHENGKFVASGGSDGLIRVWNISNYDDYKLINSINSNTENVNNNKSEVQRNFVNFNSPSHVRRIAWRPGHPSQIASCSLNSDYKVYIWDMNKPSRSSYFQDKHTDVVTSFLWQGEDKVWSCGNDGKLVISDSNLDFYDVGNSLSSYSADISLYQEAAFAFKTSSYNQSYINGDSGDQISGLELLSIKDLDIEKLQDYYNSSILGNRLDKSIYYPQMSPSHAKEIKIMSRVGNQFNEISYYASSYSLDSHNMIESFRINSIAAKNFGRPDLEKDWSFLAFVFHDTSVYNNDLNLRLENAEHNKIEKESYESHSSPIIEAHLSFSSDPDIEPDFYGYGNSPNNTREINTPKTPLHNSAPIVNSLELYQSFLINTNYKKLKASLFLKKCKKSSSRPKNTGVKSTKLEKNKRIYCNYKKKSNRCYSLVRKNNEKLYPKNNSPPLSENKDLAEIGSNIDDRKSLFNYLSDSTKSYNESSYIKAVKKDLNLGHVPMSRDVKYSSAPISNTASSEIIHKKKYQKGFNINSASDISLRRFVFTKNQPLFDKSLYNLIKNSKCEPSPLELVLYSALNKISHTNYLNSREKKFGMLSRPLCRKPKLDKNFKYIKSLRSPVGFDSYYLNSRSRSENSAKSLSNSNIKKETDFSELSDVSNISHTQKSRLQKSRYDFYAYNSHEITEKKKFKKLRKKHKALNITSKNWLKQKKSIDSNDEWRDDSPIGEGENKANNSSNFLNNIDHNLSSDLLLSNKISFEGSHFFDNQIVSKQRYKINLAIKLCEYHADMVYIINFILF
ncbi:WD repeat-containing protein 24-like protein [Smittium culicis]|uniref:WD repeat-containing protein 24-like protein n=1 Tax=Smittium culicis TaxID=133412 RepID=A0A1R1YFV6_9FUNG|nr:WD repeat-containing protein 24-like protein [Smittium culicis]